MDMKNYTKEQIMEMVEEEDVGFIRLQFTDIFGTLKNVAITRSQLEKALNNECMFDGSSIEGYARMEESDMYLYPDLNTFEIFPWRPQQGKVARLICDVYKPDGTPFEQDPRQILKNVIAEAKAAGYEFHIRPALEFFLFHTDEQGLPTTVSHENASYFDLGPIDFGENARRDMVLTLEDMGFEIEASYHESAAAQHEIDFKQDKTLATADNIMTFRMVVKTIAKRHGLHATFMPKPKTGVHGSGMHISIYAKKDGRNCFVDQERPEELSAEAHYFIGGVLAHIKAITFLTNPLVNSYKRLMSGYEAPMYIAWSEHNSTPLIHVPTNRGRHTRIELTSPDASANPYLALAACLKAGLEGLQNKTLPPASVERNIQHISEAERAELGLDKLPETLREATAAFAADELICGVVGRDLAKTLIREKKKEFEEYVLQVTPWELDKYLHRI